MSYELQSGFSGFIKDTIEYRAVMGHGTKSYKDYLANFDRFCVKHYPKETILTEEIALNWSNDANGKDLIKRMSVLRGFGRHLLAEGQPTYIIPTSFNPKKKAADLPYIFNDDELKRFFEATDRYPQSYRSPLLEYTVPTIFRLQFSCGLRPQEVRLLKRLDFDFNNNTIYIADGKHRKDRKLPVDTSIMRMCRNYDKIVETNAPDRTYFFSSPTGKAYSKDWLICHFDKCWEMSGNVGGRGKCTPYTLRHNFATQILMLWMEEDKDIDSLVAYLSEYLGHDSFEATYYYVHLIPKRLSKMPFMSVDGIIPRIEEVSL